MWLRALVAGSPVVKLQDCCAAALPSLCRTPADMVTE